MMATYGEVWSLLAKELKCPELMVRRYVTSLMVNGVIDSERRILHDQPCSVADAIKIIGALMLTDTPDQAAIAVTTHDRFVGGLQEMAVKMALADEPPAAVTLQCTRLNGPRADGDRAHVVSDHLPSLDACAAGRGTGRRNLIRRPVHYHALRGLRCMNFGCDLASVLPSILVRCQEKGGVGREGNLRRTKTSKAQL